MREDDALSLPKGWKIKKLGELGKVSMCKRILKNQTLPIGDIPFYKIGTFGKKPNAFISKEVYEAYRNKYSFPKKGDILISASGTIGRRVIYDGKPAYFQDSNIVWIDNNEEEVLNKYLYKYYGFCNWNPSKGATISRLYNYDLKQIQIPIPPLPEQKRIVSILDRAFEAIDKAKANAEQNLKNAKELFESYLQGVFENKGDDWEEKTLGAICDIRTGKLNANAMVENGKYPFFTCSREIYSINDYAFDCKAVLLAGNNASGDFNVKIYTGKFNAYQRTYVITTTNEFKLELLKYKLENHLSELKKQSVGANTRFLKLAMIKDIVLNYPKSITEQQQIVQKLDALSAKTKKLESIYQQKIDNLDELKKSILQKAFAGKLK